MPDAWQEPNLSHPHNFCSFSGCASAFSARWSSRGCNGLLAPSSSPVYDFSANDPLPFALIVGAMGSMVNLLAHGLVDNSVFVPIWLTSLCYYWSGSESGSGKVE